MEQNTSNIKVINYFKDTSKDSGKVVDGAVYGRHELHAISEEALSLGFDVQIKQLKKPTEDNVEAILYYSDKGFGQR